MLLSKVTHWINAIRIRTLSLSLASILFATIIASKQTPINWNIFSLTLITAFLLQILSNLANDYGDSIHGADNNNRKGPTRSVQKGTISPHQMKIAIYIITILSLLTGITLLLHTFAHNKTLLFVFLSIGILSIIAAIAYTNGKKPYGYKGLGDIFVFLFFGIIAVEGSFIIFTSKFNPQILLPAITMGTFATGVLNINNIRDIQSDKIAGKRSIPVRIGKTNAILYQWTLIIIGITTTTIYTYINNYQPSHLLASPLFIAITILLHKHTEAHKIDSLLKAMAISSLLFVILFGFGNI
ncbi:MAG: 1,4-dihydroxy-2-naphthoate octaprenyltransferase [Chitinophagaceae bacterium]|nr:1,4-dihydroxy-2-naphthoate octaprenyltransferase [Chitinophagaceae bacterium]